MFNSGSYEERVQRGDLKVKIIRNGHPAPPPPLRARCAQGSRPLPDVLPAAARSRPATKGTTTFEILWRG